MQRREAGICFDFQKGKCNRGARCRFSHDPKVRNTAHNTARNTAKGSNRDDDAVFPELKKWKDQVFQRTSLGFGLGEFLGQASRLVQMDDSCRQEVIKSLATDRGLEKVLEIVNQDFARMSDKALMHTFDTRIIPFFCVLSDERVMSSPLLERHLGEICQYIYGVGGSRSELLFAASVRALSTLLSKSDLKFFTALKATLAVLMKVVEFNSTAKVTPCFSTYATTLAAMLAPQSDPDADALRYQATKHLDSINKRLGIGAAIRSIDSAIQDKGTALRPVFSLTRSLPGRLANGRPRHNNDFDSIHDIQIMPTSEEIQSTHAEYLPSQDPSTWHMRGVEGLLDRHFRLLREDTIGQLRDSARVELEALQGMEPQHGNSTLRKHTYRNVLVELPKFDSLRGLEFVISFDQPPELRSKSKNQRQDWWAHSKRLDGDALICLISSTQVFVFCSICFPHDPWKKSGKDKERGPDPHRNIVSHTDDRIRVIARPSEMNAESVANILGMSLEPVKLQINSADQVPHSGVFSQKDFQGGRSLVEFPGVLLPAFMPTLTALKAIFKSGELPFSHFLAPPQGSGEETAVVPPPTYTQRAGFRFNLRSVVQNGDFSFDPSSLKQSDIKDLQEASTLDETQASALLNSLSRSFALIQGPPGTGKSYTGVALMKTLVSNKKAAKLGPILVVTFTNHALDQSLEHLLDQGIGQIVRIGGNSKSERLASVNLKVVAAKVERTRAENSEYGRTRSHMDEDTEAIVQCLEDLRQDTNNIKEYLARKNRHHYVQLFGADRDEDGWQEARHGKKGQRYKKWLRGGNHLKSSRALNTIVKTTSLYDLSNNERGLLHDFWLRMAQKPILDSLMDNVDNFNKHRLGLDAIKNETDLRALSQANVIGVTTSGLARNLELLRKLPSKILLCEEAGEVLEAHLLTALLPSIEHAILIGDHLQLRPHVSCYGLSQESVRGQQYALDTSLFERLVTATIGGTRLPFSRLDTQRRMHPEIAELVRSTLYPELSDAPSTIEHPQAVGLKKRLFWLDHHQPETHNDMHSTSHSNDYEVAMTTALVSHLIKQGVYKPGSIAVLTPYVGQLKKLQLRMQSAFEVVLDDRDIKVLEEAGLDDAAQSRAPPAPGVQKGSMASAIRLATVDNFQGEEAEVVVISLVRSNDQHSCGFLRTSNRINVLLSRAKNGMYIIGNCSTTQHVPMWTKVLELLQMNHCVGEVMELACERHPDDIMQVAVPDDFVRLAPDGGCVLPCTQRLLCGHACDSSCHSQVLHDAVKCLEPCPRQPGSNSCSHSCPNKCGEICPSRCMAIVKDITVKLPCGHVKTSLPCWLYFEQDQIVCQETVTRMVPGCGHEVQVKCCQDVNSDNYLCLEECCETLVCGHVCKKFCKDCKKRVECRIVETDHGSCRQPCGRDFLNCSHSCKKSCHDGSDCGLCDQPCEVKCEHSRCGRSCSEPCAPCANEKCSSCCPHSECSMPCGAPCDWVPCSQRCTDTLKCGHQCPSVCGAPCPEVRFCQECADENIKSRVVDLIMMSQYSDIDLDEDPCIFPTCGHFYTIATMDGHLSLGDHYVLDVNGLPTALKAPEDGLDVDKTRIICPDCRRSLREIPRYGRVVRRALLIQSTLKFITRSNKDYVMFYGLFIHAQKNLQQTLAEAVPAQANLHLAESRDKQIHIIRSGMSKLRYGAIVHIRNQIDNFKGLVGSKEQPFKRVQTLVRHARLNQRTAEDFTFDESVILQTRSYSLATSLLIRCDLTILSDVLAVRSSKDLPVGVTTTVDFVKNRVDCEALFKIAEEGKHYLQQAEALIFWAHFAALEVSWRLKDDAGRYV